MNYGIAACTMQQQQIPVPPAALTEALLALACLHCAARADTNSSSSNYINDFCCLQ